MRTHLCSCVARGKKKIIMVSADGPEDRDASADETAPRENSLRRGLRRLAGEISAPHDRVEAWRVRELSSDVFLGLCEHLGCIGVKATPIEQNSPEAKLSFFPLLYERAVGPGGQRPESRGGVRIEDRNLNKILLQTLTVGGWEDGGREVVAFIFYYVVEGTSWKSFPSLEADFEADWPDSCCLKSNFISRPEARKPLPPTEHEVPNAYSPPRWLQPENYEVKRTRSNPHWEGGELASVLNSDSYLTRLLYSGGLDSLHITQSNRTGKVRILHSHFRTEWVWAWSHPKSWWGIDRGPFDLDTEISWSVGRGQFPSREAFEAYDRIAWTIRRFVNARENRPRLGTHDEYFSDEYAKALVVREREDVERQITSEREEARMLASGELGSAILALLEREGGLSAKDIGDDLRQTAPTLQNTEVVRALLRLMEEGRVSRVQGEETQGPRAMRYYKK